MSTTRRKQRAPFKVPTILDQLIEALVELREMDDDPEEQARRCRPLQDAAKSVLAAYRGRAMYRRTTGKGAILQEELAARLGINKGQVSNSISRFKASEEPE